MVGVIHEFFGFPAGSDSLEASDAVEQMRCPFLGSTCVKTLNDGTISGVCSVKPQTSNAVVCCPIRLYADEYKILRDVADRAFESGLPLYPGRSAKQQAEHTGKRAVAVFGKGWGGELRLPKRGGTGNYFVDWVLALMDEKGELLEFVAVEVQTIDTTGNYRSSRLGLLDNPRRFVTSSVGLNWENVNKRILPQLIYKGQVLQREELCRKGLFFVSPTAVYDRIMARLGGREGLISYALPPASITFLAYDVDCRVDLSSPLPASLSEPSMHSTTVYKVQEAFNNVALPEANVYRSAIDQALGSVH